MADEQFRHMVYEDLVSQERTLTRSERLHDTTLGVSQTTSDRLAVIADRITEGYREKYPDRSEEYLGYQYSKDQSLRRGITDETSISMGIK